MKFICKVGEAQTTSPWTRPELERVKTMLTQWSQTPGFDNYEIYLLGNFAEKTWGVSTLETWDVDVVLIGEITDPQELFNLMTAGTQLGFDNGLLMDIFHDSQQMDIAEPKEITMTRAFNTFYKNINDIITEYTLPGELIEGGLYQSTSYPDKGGQAKAHQRYLDGVYQGIIKNIKDINQ